MNELTVVAVPGLPEIEQGADLPALVEEAGVHPGPGDVVVISHKIVSKAEGRVVELAAVRAGERAVALAADLGADAQIVQVVLDESTDVVRAARGVLITRTHHGFVCANAGVDSSNAPREGTVVLLPRDPDASARALRARWLELCGRAPAVAIADSFGRAWRRGQAEAAIGCAGLVPLDDWRGRSDSRGLELRATWIAVADQAVAAADLVRSKDSREPVVIVSGLERFVTADDGPGAAELLRPEDEDLFR